MARRSSSSSSWWRLLQPSYYLKRPKRLAALFIAFVCLTFLFWDRQTLVREHEVELIRLKGELDQLRVELHETKSRLGGFEISKDKDRGADHIHEMDPLEIQRREKVKEAMIHAWTSYEKYAWGQDELQPQSKSGTNSFCGLGATIVDSLDTLYIMGLDKEFQKAKEWVARSLDFNKECEASVFETTIRLIYKV